MPSGKRKQLLKEYAKLRRRFLTKHRNCIVTPLGKPSRCTNPATEIHHRKGRGKYLLSIATWMPLCSSCHRQIHDNPNWARKKEYLLRRFSRKPIVPLKELS